MNLKKYLSPENILLDLKSTSKNDVINELVDFVINAQENGASLDREEIVRAVFEREAQMSTGMRNGIAIPHGKTDAVTDLLAAIAISRNDVDFDSLDGKPSKIFIFTLSPSDATGLHLQFLAEVSNLLKDGETRNRMLEAKTKEEMLQIFFGEKKNA
jgi:PTS system nitrogen regulatory IIA component